MLDIFIEIIAVPAVRLGDIISLKDAVQNSYLFTEGILVDDVCIAARLDCFEDALFQIEPQHQYSALGECKEFEDDFINGMEPDKKTIILHSILKVL